MGLRRAARLGPGGLTWKFLYLRLTATLLSSKEPTTRLSSRDARLLARTVVLARVGDCVRAEALESRSL